MPWLQEERPWEWNKPCSYLEVWSEVLYMRLKCYSDQGNSAPILVNAAIALLNSGVVYIKFWYRINLHWNYTGSQLWSELWSGVASTPCVIWDPFSRLKLSCTRSTLAPNPVKGLAVKPATTVSSLASSALLSPRRIVLATWARTSREVSHCVSTNNS